MRLSPRLVEKQKAGGRDNFRRMTGLRISDTTSMGVSPVGETYANSWPRHSHHCDVVFGTFYAGSYYLLFHWSQSRVLFVLWLPLIFSQAVKCETELACVLNHLVKAALVAMILYVLHLILFGKGHCQGRKEFCRRNVRFCRKVNMVRSP